MSYYYDYFIGKMKDGKIYPLGPYNADGKIKSVISRSSSFASNLHHKFFSVPKEKASPELEELFTYTNWKGERAFEVKCLPYNELPDDDFVKKGYFLTDDILTYENDKDSWDIFYDHLTPTAYALLVEKELKFGKPAAETDEFGNDVTPHSASDYSYYAYPDYNCEEYETFVIKRAVGCLSDTYDYDDIVILMTEG